MKLLRVTVALACLASAAARATTFTVTGPGDDLVVDGVVTLREALTAANTNAAAGDAPAGSAGLDTIGFALPGAGLHTIVLGSALMVTEAVVIDGYTQPGASANTLAVGDNAVLLVELDGTSTGGASGALIVAAGGSGSTVRGLVVDHAPAAGISLVATSGNTLAGNFIGVDATGLVAVGNNSCIRLGDSSANLIGGTAPADRNVLGACVLGVFIADTGPTPLSGDNVVQGDYIGTDATGTAAIATANAGVYLATTAAGNVIGGTAVGAGNVISGNAAYAIYLAPGNGVTIQGNLVGVAADGFSPLGNGGGGLQIMGTGNVIGGTTTGAGNVIADNVAPPGQVACGVHITPGSSGNAILGNSIYGNSTLGISLGNDTPTPNDPGDADTGPNGLQNYPVVTAVTFDGTKSAITGTLDSAASDAFRVELYGNDHCDVSGYGQAQRFLGAVAVSTDATGKASFTTSVTGDPGIVTATATGPDGSTSELSACTASVAATIVDMAIADLAPAGADLSSTDAAPAVASDLAVTDDRADLLPTDLAARRADDLAHAAGVASHGCDLGGSRGSPLAVVLVLVAFVALRRQRSFS